MSSCPASRHGTRGTIRPVSPARPLTLGAEDAAAHLGAIAACQTRSVAAAIGISVVAES